MKFKSLGIVLGMLFVMQAYSETIRIVSYPHASNRVVFATDMLSKSLKKSGYQVIDTNTKHISSKEKTILAIEKNDPDLRSILKQLKVQLPDSMKKEGFFITTKKNTTLIVGTDGSGVIYGCRELIDRLNKDKKLDLPASYVDAPEMVLRGTCIGIQKTSYLPGRTVYEYPYTPESFPWFYDKKQWIE